MRWCIGLGSLCVGIGNASDAPGLRPGGCLSPFYPFRAPVLATGVCVAGRQVVAETDDHDHENDHDHDHEHEKPATMDDTRRAAHCNRRAGAAADPTRVRCTIAFGAPGHVPGGCFQTFSLSEARSTGRAVRLRPSRVARGSSPGPTDGRSGGTRKNNKKAVFVVGPRLPGTSFASLSRCRATSRVRRVLPIRPRRPDDPGTTGLIQRPGPRVGLCIFGYHVSHERVAPDRPTGGPGSRGKTTKNSSFVVVGPRRPGNSFASLSRCRATNRVSRELPARHRRTDDPGTTGLGGRFIAVDWSHPNRQVDASRKRTSDNREP